jgi:hypothetical protein
MADLHMLDLATSQEELPPVPADLAARIVSNVGPIPVEKKPQPRRPVFSWGWPTSYAPLAAAASLMAVAVLAVVWYTDPRSARKRDFIVDRPAEIAQLERRDAKLAPLPAEEQEEGIRTFAGGRSEVETKASSEVSGFKRVADAVSPRQSPAPKKSADAESGAGGIESEKAKEVAGQQVYATTERAAPEHRIAADSEGRRAAPGGKYEAIQSAAKPEPEEEDKDSAPKGKPAPAPAASPARVAALEPQPAPATDDEASLRRISESREMKAVEAGPAAIESEALETLAPEVSEAAAREIRSMTLEAPKYRITLSNSGSLAVQAGDYQCAVSPEIRMQVDPRALPLTEGRRNEVEANLPDAEDLRGLFWMAASASAEKQRVGDEDDEQSRDPDLPVYPWTISVEEPDGREVTLIDRGTPIHGSIADTRSLSAHRANIKTYTIGERLHDLVSYSYRALLEEACGALPSTLKRRR